jgi:hypothetical protein
VSQPGFPFVEALCSKVRFPFRRNRLRELGHLGRTTVPASVTAQPF